jgi:hypothetical protein
MLNNKKTKFIVFFAALGFFHISWALKWDCTTTSQGYRNCMNVNGGSSPSQTPTPPPQTLRTSSSCTVNGKPRICLDNNPIYTVGGGTSSAPLYVFDSDYQAQNDAGKNVQYSSLVPVTPNPYFNYMAVNAKSNLDSVLLPAPNTTDSVCPTGSELKLRIERNSAGSVVNRRLGCS